MEKHQSEAALLNQVNQRHLMETLLILQTTIALKEKVKPDGDFWRSLKEKLMDLSMEGMQVKIVTSWDN